jgi:uncharacterized integral membrane protein
VWVFKGLLFLILLFALVYFFVTNSGQSVDINFFGKAYLGISIYWVVVISFLVGFAASFVLAAFREFGFHREINRLRKAAKGKDREIADLRTLPLRDPVPGDDAAGTRGESSGD